MDCFVAYAPRNDDNPRRQRAHSTRSSSLRKAGTHTPCSIVFGAQAETFVSTSAGGYGSLLSQGRRWRSNIPGISAVIASAAKQSILLSSRLRGACHRARIRATRWLAMTLLWFWIRLHPRDAMSPRRCFYLPPKEGVGNAGCPLHPRSRVHLVAVERTRVTTSTPESPGIPARNGFNGFLRALLGDRACLPPSSADMFCLSPVGPTRLRELDASVGASGPHDFAVRCNISRRHAVDRSRIHRTRPATISRAKRCRVHRIPRRVRDDRDTPLCGRDLKSCRDDLGCMKTEIFLQSGLDTKQPDGQIARCARAVIARLAGRSNIPKHQL